MIKKLVGFMFLFVLIFSFVNAQIEDTGEQFYDVNGDGIQSDYDKCVKTSGDTNKCADMNQDGVVDEFEECHFVNGYPENQCQLESKNTNLDGTNNPNIGEQGNLGEQFDDLQGFNECIESGGEKQTCADMNQDGVVDEFESCHFIEGKSKQECMSKNSNTSQGNQTELFHDMQGFNECIKNGGEKQTCADMNQDGVIDEFESCHFIEGKSKQECMPKEGKKTFMKGNQKFGEGEKIKYMSGMKNGTGLLNQFKIPLNKSGMNWQSKNEMIQSGYQIGKNLLENKMNIANNWMTFHQKFGQLKNYLKQDLTQEEMLELKQKYQEFMQKLKEMIQNIVKEMSDPNFDNSKIEGYKQDLLNFVNEFISYIEKYVDENKLDQYKQIVDELNTIINENVEYRIENNQIKREYKDVVKTFLSQKLKDILNQKLDSIQDDKKEQVFNKILEKISQKRQEIVNSSLNETQKNRLIGVLSEVEQIVKSKLETLSSDDENEDILNSLLEN